MRPPRGLHPGTDMNSCSRFKVQGSRFEAQGISLQPSALNLERSDEPSAFSLQPRANSEGQASLEMTVAFIAVLLLLLGSFKVFLWVNGRIIERQINYEKTRGTGGKWDEPTTKLKIFNE